MSAARRLDAGVLFLDWLDGSADAAYDAALIAIMGASGKRNRSDNARKLGKATITGKFHGDDC